MSLKDRWAARRILREEYGEDREQVERSMCFGDCCLTKREKKALVTLIYGKGERDG